MAVDSRQPGYSVGASFEESARIMQALCAEEAVNLDGGGSTTLTIGEELVNRPSDPTGERPIGTRWCCCRRGGVFGCRRPQATGPQLAGATRRPLTCGWWRSTRR